MSRTVLRNMSGWGRYPKQDCYLHRPEKYQDLLPITPHCIARGQGRSYGDAALNEGHTLILTERLNRLLTFDKTKGILTCEAGVTLAEIIEVISPHGYFLPVTPGTQFATIGGCVASDVHGKNHHRDGSISQYIIALELITANKESLLCTPNKNSELFWASIGGMGLTGIIGSIVFKLLPVSSNKMTVCHHVAHDLDQAFLYLNDHAFDDHYMVAWIDCTRQGKDLGRSIAMSAHHTHIDDLPPNTKIKSSKTQKLGFDLPEMALNKTTIQWFNTYYFKNQSKKTKPFMSDYQSYFYPLDHITDWNRLYGKRGFIQYQCVIPTQHAYEGIKHLLETLNKYHAASFLAVLKRLGHESKGLLSFPMPGMTLALDIPFKDKKTQQLLNILDEVVLKYAGRVYLAKDACLSTEHFEAMYPRYKEWLNIKKNIDPNNVFSSSLSRRLMTGIQT